MSIAAPHDIYVRHTDKDGKSYVSEHRVWDADLFMATHQTEAQKEGGKASAVQITKEQFTKERK